jgi:hypothetical protein
MDDQNLNKLLLINKYYEEEDEYDDDENNCFSCKNYNASYECDLCKKTNCGNNKDCCISFPQYNNTDMILCKGCYIKISVKLKPWKCKKSKLRDYK